MKRRDFLKQSFILGAAGLIAPVPKVYSAPADGYSGRLLVTLQVDGGWRGRGAQSEDVAGKIGTEN